MAFHKFGIFLAPFHPVGQNPTLALEQDLALIGLLDELGYDIAWVGEHHSGGVEIIGSPEVFIAVAAERSRNIRLGASVSSLAFQHPLLLADRIVQLDHLTRGRVAISMGPVGMPADGFMMGARPAEQHNLMLQAVEVLVPLLRGETVNRASDGFTLRDASLQLAPFSPAGIEMVVAGQASPAAARTAGALDLGLLSLVATTPGGANALAPSWEIYERRATDNARVADRRHWSLGGPVHIAETRAQAFVDVKYGIKSWIEYFREVGDMRIVVEAATDVAEALVANGIAVIGSPADAIEQIRRLEEQSGGFGTFLQIAHNWANWDATQRSYDLFARQVIPAFGPGGV